jgi:hypothetical protein
MHTLSKFKCKQKELETTNIKNQREVCTLSEKIITLEEALNKSEKTVSRIQEVNKEREGEHIHEIQEAIRKDNEKLQGFIERQTCDLQSRLAKEQELQTKLVEAEMQEKNRMACVKDLEEEIRMKNNRIKSLEENLNESHSKSAEILVRYERGELDQLERALVSRVHEVAQSSQQHELIVKSNEIARVSSSGYLKRVNRTSRDY